MRIHHAKFYLTFYISSRLCIRSSLWRVAVKWPSVIINENDSACFMTCRNINKNLDWKTRFKEDREHVFKQQSWTMPPTLSWKLQKEMFLLFLTVHSGCCRLALCIGRWLPPHPIFQSLHFFQTWQQTHTECHLNCHSPTASLS